MPEEFKAGCARPELKKKPVEEQDQEKTIEEAKQSMVRVGKPAPLFTASGFYQGKFMNFTLEEYKGKWVVLCFYPGDFTFV